MKDRETNVTDLLQALAVALACLVLAGWSGRYLNANKDIRTYCGATNFIAIEMLAADLRLSYEEALKRCEEANASDQSFIAPVGPPSSAR